MALDFVAGCLGGCAGVLVGHPFDTVKVCLQTQDFRNPQYKGTFNCLSQIIRKESVFGLYKGMSSPMAGVAVVNAIVFGVYGNIQRRLPNPESYSSHAIAGAAAGFFQAFICSPMELVKTRVQLQNDAKLYKNPLDCAIKIGKSEGFRGMFRGLGITITREVPGFGTYFLSYEWMTKSSDKDAPPLSTWHMLLAGGLAGTISWVLTYPVDVIKSRIQADGMSGPRKYTGVVDCYKKSVAAEGYSFLTRGLTSTIIRAFPTNAACFAVVTWVFRLAGQEENASYQLISECDPSPKPVPVCDPKTESKFSVKIGTVLQGFDKAQSYFGDLVDWKTSISQDAKANCHVTALDVVPPILIDKYILTNESSIISDIHHVRSKENHEANFLLLSKKDKVSKHHEEICSCTDIKEDSCMNENCPQRFSVKEGVEFKTTISLQDKDSSTAVISVDNKL